MPTVLGKRTRSNSNNMSPNSTPKLSTGQRHPIKRQRTCSEGGDDSNKENIPPPMTLNATPHRPTVVRINAPPTGSSPTPRSATQTPRRNRTIRSVSAPDVLMGNFQLATPPATPTSKPLNLYAQCRSLLRLSSASSLTGRCNERDIISEFFKNADYNCLYISGTPGTGKTFIVNDVIAVLSIKSKYVNCMGMGVEDIVNTARQARDDLFKGEELATLILDELEHLSYDAFPQIFGIASETFRIIGISNTHTLTAKPTDFTLTVHFKPYTAAEMSDIISKRIESLELPVSMPALIQPAALGFACRKVSTQTGDLRACLSLVRSAIDMAEKDHTKKVLGQDGEVPVVPVTMSHVLAALKAATAEAPGTVGVVRSLNLQSRLVLLSILLGTRRLTASLPLTCLSSPSKPKAKGTKATAILSEGKLFNLYSILLNGNDAGFLPVSRSEFADLLGLLETQGLVERLNAATTGRKSKTSDGDAQLRMPSGSREEEMVRGLTVPQEGKEEGPKEREIHTIWNKEMAKIKREIEAREAATKKKVATFDDADEA